MHEATYFIAILVHKNILTRDEAKRLQRGMSEGYVNANLEQMLSKVEKSLVVEEQPLETIDAKSILNK